MTVSFVLPRGGAPPPFFDLPWPTELRRGPGPGARPDFSVFPGADTLAFGAYVEAAERDVDGYSVAPAIYFHLSAPLAAPRLPAEPRATLSARSPVFLADVDPASPERGTFYPLDHRYYPTALRFVPEGTLAVKPVAGFVLRPGTLYAAVVRRELGGQGSELGTVMDLEAVKWTRPRADPHEEAARRLHADALDYLASLGAPRERIAGVALFRTQVPEAVTTRMLEVATRLSGQPGRAPRVIEARWADALARRGGTYVTLEGVYCTPNFQSAIERAPYLVDDGGNVLLAADGTPQLSAAPRTGPYASGACGDLLRARFVLTVPVGPMPEAGFPLLVSAHGTGGDAEDFLGTHNFAGWAARAGVAVVSTDQPLHGGQGRAPRPGSREPFALSIGGIPVPLYNGAHAAEAAFYNPVHPAAARDNLRQAALDGMMLARILVSTDFATARGADGALLLAPTPGREPPRFDRTQVLAAGHSQGAQSAAVMGAVDPLVRGVILSGCGGDARLGILLRDDLPMVPVFRLLLGLADGELDAMHPLMTLLQTLADPIDPASYARLYREPTRGRRPPSVLHYEGMRDSYVPAATAELLAVALRATPLSPVLKALPWLGIQEATLGDLLARPGPTRAFAQIRPTHGEDGHFVLFLEPEAADLAVDFMRGVTR